MAQKVHALNVEKSPESALPQETQFLHCFLAQSMCLCLLNSVLVMCGPHQTLITIIKH
jgi:hypothetical protein